MGQSQGEGALLDQASLAQITYLYYVFYSTSSPTMTMAVAAAVATATTTTITIIKSCLSGD